MSIQALQTSPEPMAPSQNPFIVLDSPKPLMPAA
jgi:hypothetical protein